MNNIYILSHFEFKSSFHFAEGSVTPIWCMESERMVMIIIKFVMQKKTDYLHIHCSCKQFDPIQSYLYILYRWRLLDYFYLLIILKINIIAIIFVLQPTGCVRFTLWTSDWYLELRMYTRWTLYRVPFVSWWKWGRSVGMYYGSDWSAAHVSPWNRESPSTFFW